VSRRPLPNSPFNVPVVPRPVKEFVVSDRVTHDTYGMGTVTTVEEGIAVHVDFGAQQIRVLAPYGKLTKL